MDALLPKLDNLPDPRPGIGAQPRSPALGGDRVCPLAGAALISTGSGKDRLGFVIGEARRRSLGFLPTMAVTPAAGFAAKRRFVTLQPNTVLRPTRSLSLRVFADASDRR
jgi:hypothetical protein